VPADYEQRLVKRINELADERPRCGYRMVATLLAGEVWGSTITSRSDKP